MEVYMHDQTGFPSVNCVFFVCYVSFLLLTIPSVCAVIIAEGVVGIRRVPHLQQPCACIRMGDRYGKTKKGADFLCSDSVRSSSCPPRGS